MPVYTKSKFKLSAKNFILRKNTGTKKNIWLFERGLHRILSIEKEIILNLKMVKKSLMGQNLHKNATDY